MHISRRVSLYTPGALLSDLRIKGPSYSHLAKRASKKQFLPVGEGLMFAEGYSAHFDDNGPCGEVPIAVRFGTKALVNNDNLQSTASCWPSLRNSVMILRCPLAVTSGGAYGGRASSQSKKSRSSSRRCALAFGTLNLTPKPGESHTSMKPFFIIGSGRPSTISFHHSGWPMGYSKAI